MKIPLAEWILMGLRLVLFALLAYGLVVGLMTAAQRWLIYIPARESTERLKSQAVRMQLEPWLNREGLRIGWRREPAGGTADFRILIFHGNAGHALNRAYYADGFSQLPAPWRCAVYLVEYPGYGDRGGEPSEATLSRAADEALQTVLEEESGGTVIAMGESLGAAVATGLAARAGGTVRGLILVTPMNNLTELAAYHFPWLPVRWILWDRFAADEQMRKFTGPVAFLLAERDEVVPTIFSQRLIERVRGPHQIWVQAATHNTVDFSPGSGWWQEVMEFLRRNLQRAATGDDEEKRSKMRPWGQNF